MVATIYLWLYSTSVSSVRYIWKKSAAQISHLKGKNPTMLKLPLRMRMRAIVVQWHPTNNVCTQRSIVFEYSVCFGVRNILELKWCIKIFRRHQLEVRRKEEITNLAMVLLRRVYWQHNKEKLDEGEERWLKMVLDGGALEANFLTANDIASNLLSESIWMNC